MLYQFKCKEHGNFEVVQPMLTEHKANCPQCGVDCQRVYYPIKHTWSDSAFRPDGSYRQDSDYAPVMNG